MSGSDDGKVLFHGSTNSDVNHFMSYFENLAEFDSEGEIRARAFIKYLREEAIHFYFSKFIVQSKLTGKTKNYECTR